MLTRDVHMVENRLKIQLEITIVADFFYSGFPPGLVVSCIIIEYSCRHHGQQSQQCLLLCLHVGVSTVIEVFQCFIFH